jgi:membrane associated rhomboid family serine protease
MIATAFLYPDARISLLFPPVTLTMRSFALIILGIATLVVLMNGHNAGGEAAHLGGAVMGLIIMLIWQWRVRNRYRNY